MLEREIIFVTGNVQNVGIPIAKFKKDAIYGF